MNFMKFIYLIDRAVRTYANSRHTSEWLGSLHRVVLGYCGSGLLSLLLSVAVDDVVFSVLEVDILALLLLSKAPTGGLASCFTGMFSCRLGENGRMERKDGRIYKICVTSFGISITQPLIKEPLSASLVYQRK